ncbi:MAG: glycosyltransferase family 25 protein [Parashewanella sp.]
MTPPIYLINMPQNSERLENIQSQLAKLNLKAEKINAVVGKELTKNEIQPIYDHELNKRCNHRDLTIGELGCYASHRKAWRTFLNTSSSHTVIIE